MEEFIGGFYYVGRDIDLGEYIIKPINYDGAEVKIYRNYNEFINGNEYINEYIENEYHIS